MLAVQIWFCQPLAPPQRCHTALLPLPCSQSVCLAQKRHFLWVACARHLVLLKESQGRARALPCLPNGGFHFRTFSETGRRGGEGSACTHFWSEYMQLDPPRTPSLRFRLNKLFLPGSGILGVFLKFCTGNQTQSHGPRSISRGSSSQLSRGT